MRIMSTMAATVTAMVFSAGSLPVHSFCRVVSTGCGEDSLQKAP